MILLLVLKNAWFAYLHFFGAMLPLGRIYRLSMFWQDINFQNIAAVQWESRLYTNLTICRAISSVTPVNTYLPITSAPPPHP